MSSSSSSASISWQFSSAAPELAQAGSGAGFVMGAHVGIPQVQTAAGAVLATPKIKVITFTEDSLGTPLKNMVSAFAASAELTEMVSEYGVGAPTVTTPTTSITNATTGVLPAVVSDTAIKAYISANFSTGFLGAADDQTIYIIMFPSSIIVSSTATAAGDFCKQGVLGFHDQYVDGSSGKKIAYAVILHCFDFPGLSSADTMTTTTSHEIVEALTDPYVNSAPAYAGLASSYSNWGVYMPGLEVGDMCELFQSSIYTPVALGYSIQRSWSNVAAAAGHNPCVPTPVGAVYFNAIPVLTDTVSYYDPTSSSSTPITASGVTIAVGSSRTIALQLFSDAPTSANWTVSAFEDPNMTYTHGADLSFSFDSTTGSNGSTIHMTIHVLRQDVYWSAEPVWIVSTLNGVKYYWPLLIGN